MERNEGSLENPGGAMEQLIYQDTATDTKPNKQVSDRSCWRYRRPAEVSLGLLAIVLLSVDIGLGLYYKNLTDAHHRLHDIDRLGAELNALEDAYQSVIQTVKDVQKELAIEQNRLDEPYWEREHHIKTHSAFVAQFQTLQGEVVTLKAHLTGLGDGCRFCSPGWIFMHSMCYYIPSASFIQARTWDFARNYCRVHGGDLAIIDSKDKENSTVRLLLRYTGVDVEENNMGFWFGLVLNKQRWQWLDGRDLVEGYWYLDPPRGQSYQACAAVHPRENFFKAWLAPRCSVNQKWICEKTPYF